MATKKTKLTEEEIVAQAQAELEQEEELLFPEGPSMEMVERWKEEYGQVYMTEIDDDEVYLWRILTRKEFKEIMKLDNADAMYREERVCEKCVVWPEGYTFVSMGGGKAGAPTVLAEQIMEKSGFQPRTGPIAL